MTWTILDALTGGKPDEVDLYQLAAHVDRQVPIITKAVFGIRQRPHSKIEGNFPIGVRVNVEPSTGAVAAKKIPKTPTHALLRSERVREKPEPEATGKRQLPRGTQVRVVRIVDDKWAVIALEGQEIGYLPVEALLPLR